MPGKRNMSNDAERLKRYAQSRKEKRHVRPVAQNILEMALVCLFPAIFYTG